MLHHRKWIQFYLGLCLVLSACGTVPGPVATPSPLAPSSGDLTPIDLQSGFGVRGPWFELYFTDPASPLSPQATGGVDGPIVDSIRAARLSIDVAIYSISLNSIRYALIDAHKRGVQVRMVMESTNMDRSDPQALLAAGIPIVGDEMPGLMHNKFIVIDKSEVWLGSMNYTDSGAYDDNNNMIHIKSTKMAEDYLTEFNEMFVQHKFGPNVARNTPNPTVTLDGTRIDVYFSPDDGVLNALVPLLQNARSSIYFLTFSFTSNELGEIVRQQAQNGLDIEGVMDQDQIISNQGTEYDPFKQANLDVSVDGNLGLMHHKVFIIDQQIVVFGSYNFSQSAELRNDENLIVVYNPAIAAQFVQEFRRVQSQAQP